MSAPQERLGEAVDRRERPAELLRHGRDELGLHLLHEPVGRDVAEGVDPPRDGARRVAHDRLRHRQPDLVPASDDRDETVARGEVALALQAPAEHLLRRPRERLGGGDVGDLLRGAVPEHDLAVAVDGHDPVGDVGEDREAALLLDRHALVELGVLQRRGRARGQRGERLDLVDAPRPRLGVVERQHAEHRALGADERDRGVRAHALTQDRVGRGVALVRPGVLERERRPRLGHVPDEPARQRRAVAEEEVGLGQALDRGEDELVVLDEADRRRVHADERHGLAHDLVEHRRRVELGREHRGRAGELLRQRAGAALVFEDEAPLERSRAPRRRGGARARGRRPRCDARPRRTRTRSRRRPPRAGREW